VGKGINFLDMFGVVKWIKGNDLRLLGKALALLSKPCLRQKLMITRVQLLATGYSCCFCSNCSL
jgi:hypothetical protein